MSARREMTEGFDLAQAEAVPPQSLTSDAVVSAVTSAASQSATPFASATHAALFVTDETVRCDVCDALVAEDADDGYAVAGRGLYVWARGEDVRYEEPHLCAGCAAAVGVSALARWEIEEEEG